MKSQRDSSFPADGHKAILNKMNTKSKTNRKRTNIDSKNKPQQKHRLGTVSYKLLGFSCTVCDFSCTVLNLSCMFILHVFCMFIIINLF